MKIISSTVVFLILMSGCDEKDDVKVEPVPVSEAASSAKANDKNSQKTESESPCKLLSSLPADQRPPIPKDAALIKVTESSGALELPDPGMRSDETHNRHPWKMPKGAANAVAVVHWDDTSFGDVEFAIGTGLCPHRGLKLAEAVSSTGTAVVHYEHSPDRAWPEPDWFLHVNADKALETKGGEELKYSYEICAY